MNSERGFTVVEFFVSIFLTLIILGVVYSVYRLQTHSLKVQEKRLDAQQYTRSIISLMVREVRNVGHFPTGATGCSEAHTFGIVEADKQVFHFVYDSNDDQDCTDTGENIRYSFTTVGCPAGYGNILRQDRFPDPLNPPPPITLTECNVPTTDGDFSFAYYAKDATLAYTNPVSGGNLGGVQRVLIKASVESKSTDTEFGPPSLSVMSSNVNLRNRGLPP